MWEPKSDLLHDEVGESLALERVNGIWEEIRGSDHVITSHNFPNYVFPVIEDGMPAGIKQFQIPLLGQDNSLFFITFIEPYAAFPIHVHSNSSVFRLVMNGNIVFNGASFEQGEWMFIPAKVPYSLEAGVRVQLSFTLITAGDNQLSEYR